MTDLEIRPLTYADLPQVIAIERRAFPTPWSLAMFVLELSKPSGICLAALIEERMVGYLVCSRYDTVWHLMNVAVDDRLRRQGIATALLDGCSSWATGRRAVHAGGEDLQRLGDPPVRGLQLPHGGPAPRVLPRQREDALIMWRTVPAARRRGPARDPRARDELRRHLRRRGDSRGRDRSERDRLPGALHARYGGVVPEIAARHHLELVDAVVADAPERAGAELDEIETVAVTRGPGLIGALLVGLSAAKAMAARGGFRSCRSTTSTATWWRARWGPSRWSRPTSAWWPVAVTPLWPGWMSRRPTPSWGRRWTTLRERPSTRALAAGTRVPGRAGRRSPRPRGRPHGVRVPRSAPGELDFSFSGLKTSLLYTLRDRPDADRADLAASYQRAIVDALTSRTRQALEREGLERLAIGGGVAANSELRAAVGELGVPVWVPPVELCTDNAAMIGAAARFLEPLPYPDYLALDAAARIA